MTQSNNYFRQIFDEVASILISNDRPFDERLLEARIHDSRALYIKNATRTKILTGFVTKVRLNNLSIGNLGVKKLISFKLPLDLVPTKLNGGIHKAYLNSTMEEFDIVTKESLISKLRIRLSMHDNYIAYDKDNYIVYVLNPSGRVVLDNELIIEAYLYNPLAYYSELSDTVYKSLTYEIDPSKKIYIKNLVLSAYGFQSRTAEENE